MVTCKLLKVWNVCSLLKNDSTAAALHMCEWYEELISITGYDWLKPTTRSDHLQEDKGDKQENDCIGEHQTVIVLSMCLISARSTFATATTTQVATATETTAQSKEHSYQRDC